MGCSKLQVQYMEGNRRQKYKFTQTTNFSKRTTYFHKQTTFFFKRTTYFYKQTMYIDKQCVFTDEQRIMSNEQGILSNKQRILSHEQRIFPNDVKCRTNKGLVHFLSRVVAKVSRSIGHSERRTLSVMSRDRQFS